MIIGRRAGRAIRGGLLESPLIRPRPGNAVDPLREHRDREVERLDLHILGKREDHGSGVGRIGEDASDLWQRRHELFRARDPIEVAGDRPECIVDRDRRVAK